MKKLVLSAAAIAAVLFAPGFAQAYPKQGWYIGGAGGLTVLQDSDVESGGVTEQLSFDPGFAVSASGGFGFENQFRPEIEINYRRNEVDQASGAGASGGSGNFSSLGFMVNLFYDFDTHTGLTPYVGVGIGGAMLNADSAGSVFTGDTVDEESWQMAYQGIAGFSFELSEHLDLTADYRYFSMLEPDLKTAAGSPVDKAKYASHNFMLGLRYVFGIDRALPEPVSMREAARPVVVMPPPPPMMAPAPMPAPMPMVESQQQMMAPPPPMVPETYIVFFDFDKYYLTAEAKETLHRAADAFRAGGKARVEVTGHTDTSGSYRYNKRLSERRARIVKEYMVALGIPADEIGTHGAGETHLMVATGNNVREAKNRRAEIIER